MPKSPFPQPEWTTPTLRQSWIVENGLCSFPLVVGPDDLHCVSSGKGEQEVYVKAKKQAKWLYKCLKGHGANKGALQRSTVCELLLHKFKIKTQDGSEASGSQDKSTVVDVEAEGAAASTVVEAACPGKMELLDRSLEWDDESPAKPAKKAKMSPTSFTTVDVEMPKSFESAVAGTRTVRLLARAAMPRTVYVHEGDFGWLMDYMHEEVLCAGVPGLADVGLEDSPPTSEEGAAAAAPYALEWNFHESQWEATFLVGPLQGKKARCSANTFTKEKFDEAMQGEKEPPQWDHASPYVKREAMRKFLVLNAEAALKKAGL